MAVTVEMHNTGDAELKRNVAAMIEHVLSDRPGTWRVVIIDSRGNDQCEMRIPGPNAFERSCTLEGALGQHHRGVVGDLVARMVTGRS
jgi:hypothetical protein